jgi:aerobic carbon-monoxide dehydrogenase medium subunit
MLQTPPPFEYERAASLDDALALLERYGPESRLLAGGQSLLAMMKLRLVRPEVLIDVNDLTDLSYIRLNGGEIRIGALCRHRDLLASPLLAECYPIVADAERVIADPLVRNRGTLGGSLCQADPSEDLPAVFAAVRATCVIRSSNGERLVPIREFHRGPYETAVGPAEMLVEVRFPVRPGCGSAYEKVERRAGDWGMAAAGAVVRLEGGRIVEAGVGLTAVGAEHHCSVSAEEVLGGREPTEEVLTLAAAAAAMDVNPTTDQRGPAEYKRHLAGELTRRALRRALSRARESAVAACK